MWTSLLAVFAAGDLPHGFLGEAAEAQDLAGYAVAFLVRPFGAEPPKEVQEMLKQIHIPSGAGEASLQ